MESLKRPRIVGILNITEDSFSDGGLFLRPETALRRARSLVSQGADLIDLGAESSQPEGQKVSPEEQIERLTPVIRALKQDRITLSVDTYLPEVMERVLALGVDMINDITALRDPLAVQVVARHDVPVVVMYQRGTGPRAERAHRDTQDLMDGIQRFFDARIEELTRAGIRKDRIILDPGMGFFLGGNPEPSLMVLKRLDTLRKLGNPVYLSTSRKSFIGSILQRPVSQRAAGTLATEIWACLQGVDYLRTHEVAPLHDAITMIQSIQTAHG